MAEDNEMDDLWADDGEVDAAVSGQDGGIGAEGRDAWAPLGSEGSVDDMARTLSTFGMRIDALVTSTTSYRAAITDRLVEYADSVNKLVKNQAADVEEHRAANQRLLAELQRGVSASDESVGGLAERIDELLSATGTDDATHQILVETRSVLESQERLGQFLTEALDQFGDRVTERLDSGLNEVIADVRGIRDTLVDLASGDVVGALWDEVRALRDALEGVGSAPVAVAGTGGSRADIDGLTQAVTELLDAAEVVPTDEPDVLGDVAADLAQLRADLADGLMVEPDTALTDTLADIRGQVAALGERIGAGVPQETDDRLGDVVDAVADLRERLAQGVNARPTSELTDTLAGIRAGVDALGDRLDTVVADADGLRWPGGEEPANAAAAPDFDRLAGELASARADVAAIGARLDEGLVVDVVDADVADRVAALRDEVTAELEAVRQVLADAVDRPSTADPSALATPDELRAETAAAPATSAGDRASIDDLRDEIQALADMPESLFESVRTELVALRRRIKVRTESDVLSDEQLGRIADAVADRLS